MATGTPVSVQEILDELTGGLHTGDNVVLQADEDADVDRILAAALRPGSDSAPLVYITFHRSLSEVHRRFEESWDPERLLLVDCSGKVDDESAVPDVRVQRMPDATSASLRATLQQAMLDLGPGTTYVFDGLTAMQQRWSSDEALSLFVWACPKLYEERTIAYWTLQRAAHTPAFLSRLAQVTQVVIDCGRAGDREWMELRKAQGRSEDLLDARIDFVAEGDTLRVLERTPPSRQRVGRLIKQQRVAAGFSQAELARRVGVSASALSQTERGHHGISGDVLMRVWAALGVPVGEPGAGQSTHQVFPRSSRTTQETQPGVTVEAVAEVTDLGVHLVVCEPGASGNRPFFATKRREFAVVLDGLLQISIGQSDETLQQGDAIVVDEPVRAWRNPADVPARVLWALLE